MAKRVTLRGDVALRNNMRRLARLYDGKAMDIDIEAALEPLRRETEKNAAPLRNFPGKHSSFFPQPSGTPKGGHLDQGVVSARVSGTARRRVWWVSFKNRARYIAHLVEFGTKPHLQENFRGGFYHPGARAKPFFRPAFDSKKATVLETLGRRAWLRISTAAARLRK
jgi:hypothetical protein